MLDTCEVIKLVVAQELPVNLTNLLMRCRLEKGTIVICTWRNMIRGTL